MKPERVWCRTNPTPIKTLSISKRAERVAEPVGFMSFAPRTTKHSARCPDCGRSFRMRAHYCHDLCCTTFMIPPHKRIKPRRLKGRGHV